VSIGGREERVPNTYFEDFKVQAAHFRGGIHVSIWIWFLRGLLRGSISLLSCGRGVLGSSSGLMLEVRRPGVDLWLRLQIFDNATANSLALVSR
jgi:hypothetical protein